MENNKPDAKSLGQTRRDFLKSTAAGTAGAFIGSYTLMQGQAGAQNQEKPADQTVTEKKPKTFPADCREKVRLAIIGPGGMGSAHVRSFIHLANKKIDNVEITALCDVATPRLDDALKWVKEHQGTDAERYTDYRKLLESKDVDAVLIATPEHWHARQSMDALDAGKDVYVEKPLTLRIGEALRLYKFAKDRKERLLIGTQYMTYPKFADAKRLIADDAIGHPTLSQTSYCRNSKVGEWLYYGIDERIKPGETIDWAAWCGPLGVVPWNPEIYHRWRRYRRYSTGIIGDLLVHKMTPIMMAVDAGWPIRVTATGGHYVDHAMENHDQVNITAQFEKQHTMIVAGSTCNEYGLEEIIRGHKANLFTSGNQLVLRPERLFAEEVEEERFQYEGMDPHDAIRQDFLKCVRTRKQPISPVEHATKVMVIVDLATRSMWEGKAYSFCPKTMTVRSI